MFKNIFSLFVILGLLFASKISVQAYTIPQFPSCPAPLGTLTASYASGIHGIPGDFGSYSGSDKVYLVSETTVVQCFCPTQGNTGVQSNWWNISGLSQSDIDSLKKQGWFFVGNGSEWGLADAPYMVKNINFDCQGQNPTSTPTPTSTPVPSNGGTSPASAPVCTDQTPPAPRLVSVTRKGTTANLVWTAVIPVTHYTISYGTSPSQLIHGVPNTGNVNTYEIGALNPHQKYYFEVRAVNVCAPSDTSTPGEVQGVSIGGSVLGQTGDQLILALLTGLSISTYVLYLILRHRFARG